MITVIIHSHGLTGALVTLQIEVPDSWCDDQVAAEVTRLVPSTYEWRYDEETEWVAV